jgi:hypothetical protein
MVTKQDPPWPLRIPKEWKLEIEAGAKLIGISQHAFLIQLIRNGLNAISETSPPSTHTSDGSPESTSGGGELS